MDRVLRIEPRAPGSWVGWALAAAGIAAALAPVRASPVTDPLGLAVMAWFVGCTAVGLVIAVVTLSTRRSRLLWLEADERELRLAMRDLRGWRTVTVPREGTRLYLVNRSLMVHSGGDLLHLVGPESDDPARARLEELVEDQRRTVGAPAGLGRVPAAHDRAGYTLLPIVYDPAPWLLTAAAVPLLVGGGPMGLQMNDGAAPWMAGTALGALLYVVALVARRLTRPTDLELELSAHAVVARGRSRLRTREVTVPISEIRSVSVTASRLVLHTGTGDRSVPIPERALETREALQAFLDDHVARARPRLGVRADVPPALRRLVERE